MKFKKRFNFFRLQKFFKGVGNCAYIWYEVHTNCHLLTNIFGAFLTNRNVDESCCANFSVSTLSNFFDHFV